MTFKLDPKCQYGLCLALSFVMPTLGSQSSCCEEVQVTWRGYLQVFWPTALAAVSGIASINQQTGEGVFRGSQSQAIPLAPCLNLLPTDSTSIINDCFSLLSYRVICYSVMVTRSLKSDPPPLLQLVRKFHIEAVCSNEKNNSVGCGRPGCRLGQCRTGLGSLTKSCDLSES